MTSMHAMEPRYPGIWQAPLTTITTAQNKSACLLSGEISPLLPPSNRGSPCSICCYSCLETLQVLLVQGAYQAFKVAVAVAVAVRGVFSQASSVKRQASSVERSNTHTYTNGRDVPHYRRPCTSTPSPCRQFMMGIPAEFSRCTYWCEGEAQHV